MASKSSGSNYLKERLSMIIYEGKAPPRYFEINKKLLRFILISLPVITVISLVLVFSGILYFKQLRDVALRKEPVIINSLKQNIAELERNQQSLKELNKQLQNKLATGGAVDDKRIASLSLFSPIPGMKNLSASPLLSVDDAKIRSDNNKLFISFDLVNQTPGDKLISGFFFVLMKAKGTLYVHPEDSFIEQGFQVPFNQGESFATQRFRPVKNIVFPRPQGSENFLVKIIVFSRSGDLLIKKIISHQDKGN